MINERALLVEVWCTLISLNFYLFQIDFASLRGPNGFCSAQKYFSGRLYTGSLHHVNIHLNTCQKVINGLVDQMTATVFRQSYMTQRHSLFTLISYCAIVFSFAQMFASGWFIACDGFYGASACWLSHMKQ